MMENLFEYYWENLEIRAAELLKDSLQLLVQNLLKNTV